MNSVQFTGLSGTNTKNAQENNKKKNIKRAVAAAVVTGAVVAGGVAVYKNRNSKPVQKALSTLKENVLEPVNKKTSALKEKIKEAYSALKTGIKNLKKDSSAADSKTSIPDASEKPAKAPKAKKKTAEKLIQTAKDNAGKLKVAGAGLGAGAALGATGAGAVQKVNEIQKEGFKKGEKVILTADGKQFKGRFKNGKAYDEDGTPLNGKLTYLYGAGRRIVPGDETSETKYVAQDMISKTILTYKDGVLRKATHFDDIAYDKIPSFIKQYDENGKVVSKMSNFSATGEKGKLNAHEVLNYGIVENPNFVKTPVMLKKHTVEKDGTDIYRYYKKNVDETGAVKGKPEYVFSTKTKTLEDGSIQTDFYAPDTLGRGVDFLAKTAIKKPNGITKVYMMSRNLGVAGFDEKAPINGMVKSVMTLDKDGRIVSYKLPLDEDHNLDGLIRLRGGKIISVNDEAHYIQVGYPIGDAYKHAPLHFHFPDENDKFSSEIYMSHDLVSKIGVSYHEDGETVKSIAVYSEFGDFPDTITYFDKDGRPVQDVGFALTGEEVLFSPKYRFSKPAPVLPDNTDEARKKIIQTEARVLERAKAAQEMAQEAETNEKTATGA